ncbi:hypothetical protein LPJ60_001696 [Coemansia sp. RSA 2675]|nr:hypothetical protein LPJ60_001696 [Coemansia sp. RSA 2675]
MDLLPAHLERPLTSRAVSTNEKAMLTEPEAATPGFAALEQKLWLDTLTDSGQLPTQSKRSSLILLRKPAMANTAPRVPSTLRLVVDGGTAACPEDAVGDDSDDDVTAVANPSPTAIAAPDSSMPTAGRQPILNTVQPAALNSQMPSPFLRLNDSHGPALASLVNRPVDKSKCLPYPHTMDCYTPRPRPCSLNTHSRASCRLSMVTLDQEYQEFSFKKNARVSVRPSAMRGWMKMVRGKVKYSVGQVIASPSLILQGNRDISRGTAQINYSRQQQQHKRPEVQRSRTSISIKLSRRSLLSKSDLVDESKSSSSSGGSGGSGGYSSRLRAYWQQTRNDKPVQGTLLLAQNSALSERPLSVIEMAAAAETAAEVELAETSASLRSIRNMEMSGSICDGSISKCFSEETAVTHLGDSV